MSIYFNVNPQHQDASGSAYAGGALYFGDPNVDPKNNPKTVYLDEALTIPAENPQMLNDRGVPNQGTIYLQDSPERYSVLLEDAGGNQIFNVPDTTGVNLPVDLGNLPSVTVTGGTITVSSDTDAQVVIDSGVATTTEGSLEYRENGVLQWEWVRKALIDGGAILLRRLTGTSAPDEPIEFPRAGGFIARWLGAIRLQITATGVAIKGLIENNKQVVVAAGTFLHNGTPVGETLGITSAGSTGTGEYTVILDFFPALEVDLQVYTSAELASAEMNTRGAGGAPGSGTVLVYTSAGDTNARTNSTSFTVIVWDMGRT